jgi:hypothetical protein
MLVVVVGEGNSRCGSIALAALDRLGARHGVYCVVVRGVVVDWSWGCR